MQKMNKDEIIKIYEIYRNRCEHENILIDHRTTWSITIQSFLIATFGFSFQKKYEISEKLFGNTEKIGAMKNEIFNFDIFLFLLIVVGVVTAAIALRSIKAATDTIEKISEKWHEIKHQNYDIAMNIPDIGAAGDRRAREQGQWLSKALPVFFMAFWTCVFVFIIKSSLDFKFAAMS